MRAQLADRGCIDERIMRPDLDPERSRPLGDPARYRPEGQQAEDASSQPPDRLPCLPAPFILTGRSIVLADLAGGGQPERNGVVGNFVRAPVVRGVRYLDV